MKKQVFDQNQYIKQNLKTDKNVKATSEKTVMNRKSQDFQNQIGIAQTFPDELNQNTQANSCFQDIRISPDEPIIMASFLLPYQIQRDARSGQLSIHTSLHDSTIMYANLESMIQKQQINFKWVGIVITPCELSEVEKDQLNSQFELKSAYAIFMTAEEIAPYLIFYENHIRMLFHSFQDLKNISNCSQKNWHTYIDLNQKFAEQILIIHQKLNSIKILIHNNHLLMLPSLLKKLLPLANIGHVFHSPFPNCSHFETTKFRFEMLKSLLTCDLICFNLFIYAKNFIGCVQRLFSIELEFFPEGYFGFEFHGKKLLIKVSPIGINQSFISELTKSRMFRAHLISYNNALQKHLTQENQNTNQLNLMNEPLIMSSIDSYHPMSGLKNKLLSYKLFLQRYPNYRNRIVLIQFVGSILQAYSFVKKNQKQLFLIKKMRTDVIQLRDQIHQEFGQGCLIFQESNPCLEKRLVLWTQSNIMLISELKGGLCLLSQEYICCRKLMNKFSQSAIICSEFAACSQAMKGVMVYNPFSLTDFHEILDQAICQSPETNEANMKLVYSYVCRNSMTKWISDFLKDLKYSYQLTKPSYYLTLSLGPGLGRIQNKICKMRLEQKRLNIDEVYNSLVQAKKSVIIIEIEAMPQRKFSRGSIPRVEVIEQLHNIMNDNKNIVVIIGNQTQQTLEEWFIKSKQVGINGNRFWLAAESGYLYKTGASAESQWQKQTELLDFSWKQKVREIMSSYEENIDGSFIEERQSQILWNYKSSDSEQSLLFIDDLYNQIQKIAEQEQIQIIQGSGYLEVKPIAVQKQKLIANLMQQIVKNSKIDFIFYLGSSSEDESVFKYLKQANNLFFSADCAKYICVLEKKSSEADYFLEYRDQVRPLLAKLQTASQQRKKNRSYADLTKLNNKLGYIFKLKNMNQSIIDLSQYQHPNISQIDNQDQLNKGKILIQEIPDIYEKSLYIGENDKIIKNHNYQNKSNSDSVLEIKQEQVSKSNSSIKEISQPILSDIEINENDTPKQEVSISIKFESSSSDQIQRHSYNNKKNNSNLKKESSIGIDEEFFYQTELENQQIQNFENSEQIFASEFESFAKESELVNPKSQKYLLKLQKSALNNNNLNIKTAYDNTSFTKSNQINQPSPKNIPHTHSDTQKQDNYTDRAPTGGDRGGHRGRGNRGNYGGNRGGFQSYGNDSSNDFQRRDNLQEGNSWRGRGAGEHVWKEQIYEIQKQENTPRNSKDDLLQPADDVSSMNDVNSFSMSSSQPHLIKCQSTNEQLKRQDLFNFSPKHYKANNETPKKQISKIISPQLIFENQIVNQQHSRYEQRLTKQINLDQLDTDQIQIQKQLFGLQKLIKRKSQIQESSSSINKQRIRKLSQIPKNKQKLNLALVLKDI